MQGQSDVEIALQDVEGHKMKKSPSELVFGRSMSSSEGIRITFKVCGPEPLAVSQPSCVHR